MPPPMTPPPASPFAPPAPAAAPPGASPYAPPAPGAPAPFAGSSNPYPGAPQPYGQPAQPFAPPAQPFAPPAQPAHAAQPAQPYAQPPAQAPLPYAATVAASGNPAPQNNKATIMGAAAPQLRELLKQNPGAAGAQAAQPGGAMNAPKASGGAQPGGAQPAAQAAGGQPGAAAGSQFCGRCGSPMQFVAQYQRYFCQKCQQYG
jgi:hypothetical protein